MKKGLIIILTALLVVACGEKACINFNAPDLPESQVVLQRLDYNRLSLVDTLKTDKAGHFNYTVKLKGTNPEFFYLYCNNVQLASLILLPKDNVTVNTNAKGNYTVEGSAESIALKEIDDAMASSIKKMNDLIAENPENLNAQLSKVYIEHRKNMLKHIYSNPYSITAATVLFQEFNEEVPVFNQATDFIIFQSVYDSLMTVYPTSEYTLSLLDKINSFKTIYNLNAKIEESSVRGFPELLMPDVDGKMIKLSDVHKKLTVVSFWSVAQTEHLMFNNDLMDLYAKYHDKGFDVYQISLDQKPAWAAAVKSQKLPWTNVNDGMGTSSSSLGSYNIQEIPSMFVIDAEGNIIARDVYEESELEKLIKANL
ncbi:MAG: redoxin domain-containing protein [Bacteroidales bacterium]|nr:redoxin domain-containing protein [Bacteroidales bacterium]